MNNMKNSTYLFIVLLLCFCVSCKKDFFDQVPDDRLTLEQAFQSKSTAEEFLANTYSYLPDEAQGRYAPSANGGLWTGGCDEAEYDWGFVKTQNLNSGSYDASSDFVATYWNSYYQGIRSATYFISNVDKVPDLAAPLKAQYKAEARALRAIYYFYLMRIYGPVVLLNDNIIDVSSKPGSFNQARSSYDECVAFVTAQLDEAAKYLPAKPANDQNYGRVTSGYALAIKSEALLYGASPLFNGNTDYSNFINQDGKHLISQQYDPAKWKKAADAAKAFIDTYVPNTYDLYTATDDNGNFSPYLSCRDVMLKDWNSEVIYAHTNAQAYLRQYETTPYHQGFPDEVRGSGGLGATQAIVDAFFMANGKPIDDPTSGYVSGGFSNQQPPNQDFPIQIYNQWANREPRFYVNITYNQSEWIDKNAGLFITDLTYHGNSGRAAGGNDYSPTGYIVRKNMPPASYQESSRSWILLRLAEIYLNYVEALNESDPGNPDIVKYLNLIRERAGIPGYGNGVAVPVGQDAMRTAIWHERQVELAFENVRYFDVRRWKIAGQTEAGPIYGMDINSDAPAFYNLKPVETRVFTRKSYFFPIPQQDVSVNTTLVQNPGW